jgi:hypothetical protein
MGTAKWLTFYSVRGVGGGEAQGEESEGEKRGGGEGQKGAFSPFQLSLQLYALDKLKFYKYHMHTYCN